MRVAIIDPSLFTLPYDSHLCNGIAELGHEVTLYGRPLRKDESLTKHAFAFKQFFYGFSEKKRLPKRLRSIIKAVEHALDSSRLVRSLVRSQPDIVHYQWMPVPVIDRGTVRRLQQKGIPVVFTVHDTSPYNNAPTSSAQTIGWQSTLLVFNRLIVHTESSKRTLEKIGIPSEKITVIPHGLLSFGPMPEKTSPTKDRQTILFLGTIKEYKGVDILIRAFAKIKNRADVRLKIVGSAKNGIETYRSLAEELGVADAVDFDIRFYRDAEVPRFFAEATLTVFPYRLIDGSGALLTALNYEIPFVASDIGMFHELAKDDAYPLVTPEDPDALAAKLDEALHDAETLARLRAIAQKLKARIPSWNNIAATTLETYEKAAHEK